MKISIIIGACNSEKYLFQTIQCIQNQTTSDWELLIVNDGSVDLTEAIAHAFARRDSRIRVIEQAHCGIAAARNAGFAASNIRSEYLVFMDADDVWETDTLEALTTKLDAHPNAVAVCGQAYYMNAEGEPFGGTKTSIGFPEREELSFEHIAEAYELPPGAFLMRRWACEAAGLFDASVLGCEDLDFWVRLSLYGTFFPLQKLVIGYRRHETNLTNHKLLVDIGHQRFMQKMQSYQIARG